MKKSAYSFLMNNKNDSPILKCVGELLKQNKEISIDYVAKKCYMSKSGVTRYFKDNGFDGFKDFKCILLNENKTTVFPKNLDFSEFDKEIFIEPIQTTSFLNDKKLFENAFELLKKAKHNYIIGVGGNNSVCLEFKIRLERLGFSAEHNLDVHGIYVSLSNANKNSLVWFFSYTGETQEILRLANLAKKNLIKIIAITRSDDSSLSKLSDIVFKISDFEPLIRIFALKSRISMFYIIYKFIWFIYQSDCEKYDKILKNNTFH